MPPREDDTPTHTIPMALQRKLAEAKQWYDKYQTVADGDEEFVARVEAADLLEEIVEMCEQTRGLAE